MRPRQHMGFLSAAERTAYREQELELRPDLFTVFLATGGNGANNHLALLNELLPFADRLQAVVICGRNREAYNEVLHWRTMHPGFHCFLDGFSEQVHLLMQVSDVVVTRGGTTSCAKALHFRCPIIFNAIGGVMPQESLTVKFFNRGAETQLISTPADLGRLIAGWMEFPAGYTRYRESFLSLRYEEDPTVLIRELVDLAQEVSGTHLQPGPFPPVPRKAVDNGISPAI
jgi:processive 1,2-diacylglycerol beta-glucosyltransferase